MTNDVDPAGSKQSKHLSRRSALRLAGLGAAGTAGVIGLSAGRTSQASATVLTPQAGVAPLAATKGSSKLPWPAVGTFASKVVVAPHQPSAALMQSQDSLLGIPPQRAFIYGALRDKAGNLSEWVRGFPIQPSLRQGLIVQLSEGLENLRISPALSQAATPSYTASIEAGQGVWRSPDGASGNPYRLTMAEDGSTIRWTEQGLLELTGKLLGPGLQWHFPDGEGSELYVSQLYAVEGTFQNRSVSGIMGFDKVYLRPDQPLYGGKDPLFRPTQHHRTWYTWATRYTDGSYEGGHFVLGTDRLGFALLTNQRQQITLDTEVTGTVELVADEPWPKYLTVKTSDGVKWEFLPDPKGRMPDLLNNPITAAFTPQCEGRWRRVGDRRTPAAWFAWGEVAERGRTEYARYYRY